MQPAQRIPVEYYFEILQQFYKIPIRDVPADYLLSFEISVLDLSSVELISEHKVYA